MSPVASVIVNVLWLYLLVLIGRLVFDIVQMLARDWRRLPVGGISLDVAFLVLFIGLQILIAVVARF